MCLLVACPFLVAAAVISLRLPDPVAPATLAVTAVDKDQPEMKEEDNRSMPVEAIGDRPRPNSMSSRRIAPANDASPVVTPAPAVV